MSFYSADYDATASRSWGPQDTGTTLTWAGMPTRLLSAAIDYGVPIVVVAFLSSVTSTTTTRYVCDGVFCRNEEVSSSPFEMIFIVLGVLFVIANSVVMQGLTGRSAGKLLLGLTLGRPVHLPNDSRVKTLYPGIGRCFLRLVINGFFILTFCMVPISFLVMLGNRYRRTLGDMAVKTNVLARGIDVELEHGSGRSI